MSTISVRAKPGSVVRERRNGPYIPSDRFVSIEATPSIMRSIERWGDLEVEGADKAAKTPDRPNSGAMAALVESSIPDVKSRTKSA